VERPRLRQRTIRIHRIRPRRTTAHPPTQARSATAEERSSPMDWVEVQGKTVDLAVEVAMGELGLKNKSDAQIEILQEPSTSFLGMGGKDAIVKVTKAPNRRRRSRGRGKGGQGGDNRSSKQGSRSGNGGGSKKPNPQQQKSQQNTSGSKKKPAQSKGDREKVQRDDRPEAAPIEEQAKVAAGFLTGLLDAFGLEGEVNTRIDDGVLYLDVVGEQTEALVGSKGSVMYSVLELTRTVVQRKTYGAPRMRIDIAGYAERRREALKIYTGKLATQIVEEETEIMLEAMNAADRKVIHDAVAEIEHVRSYSEGEDPRRAVVLAYEA
jgi:spoIIIJ-associated protein